MCAHTEKFCGYSSPLGAYEVFCQVFTFRIRTANPNTNSDNTAIEDCWQPNQPPQNQAHSGSAPCDLGPSKERRGQVCGPTPCEPGTVGGYLINLSHDISPRNWSNASAWRERHLATKCTKSCPRCTIDIECQLTKSLMVLLFGYWAGPSSLL